MLRSAVAVALVAASADAFTPALLGLKMQSAEKPAISRVDLLRSAGSIAAGIVALPLAGNAASFDPQTGFPVNDKKRGALCNGSASQGCQPMTQAASILDKQKAILAGKITVGVNKVDVLVAEVEKQLLGKVKKAKEGEKKKAGKGGKVDKDYCLRFSALYLSPLRESMEEYALRDVNGAKAAGGAGIPKVAGGAFGGERLASASGSPLFAYIESMDKAIAAVSEAAKKEDGPGVTAAAGAVKKAGMEFLSQANAPVIFN
ncbi:hypothetical protein T484DRAFT_1967849 [Baffinella frigidus]|nr:hypothetical protein T484DRAFT_1967849 [Cryptophyta sp. CCMP2293]|mmetsp:Transcript_20137/g.46700  ORF Transcript_20137/g.46700 Transcript_20137/m.46700 type:complete len:260 (+) Transcript_20137:33-812(+)